MKAWDQLILLFRGARASRTAFDLVHVNVRRGSEVVHEELVQGPQDAYCFVENIETGNRNLLDYSSELKVFLKAELATMEFDVKTCETQVKFGQAIAFEQNYLLVLQKQTAGA